MIKQMSHLKQRLIVSSLATIILFMAIWLSAYPFFKPIFTLLIAGVVGTAVWEFYQIAKSKGSQPPIILGIALSTFYILANAVSTQYAETTAIHEIALTVILLSCFLYFFVKGENPLLNIAITLFGIVYLTIPLSCTININYFFSKTGGQDGRLWFFYLVGVTKMTDIGGYFCGKLFGKHKLAPYISPKKTWEGTFGGLLGALGFSLAFAFSIQIFDLTTSFSLTLLQSAWLGIILGMIAQIGDLSESLLKRDAGVKDSNHLPGLGGMLDIVDSLVFAAPIVYIFLRIQEG